MNNILGIQGWSVSVEVDAETILTIGHNSLSGIDDFTDAQAQVIRNCAEHLLAFIGSPRATPTPLSDAAAIAERDEPYAYEIGDPRLTQQLVYPAYLARYATDEERALPRVPLYARASLSTTKVVAWANAREDGVIVGLSQHPEDIARWLNPRALCYAHPASEPKAAAIHYPECWDTATYPTVESALSEVYAAFKCTNHIGASEPKTLTDERIIEIYDDFYTQEDDRESAHILPFARALLADRGSEGK